MPKRSSDYHSWLLTQLQDPEQAADYINAASEDSPEMFLKALRNTAEAHKMAKVAEEAGVTRESLYRTLSEEGNPRFDTLNSVLAALGLRIRIETIRSKTGVSSTTPEELGSQSTQGNMPVTLGSPPRECLGVASLLYVSNQMQPNIISHANH